MLQDGVKVFIDKKAQLSLLGKSSHPRLPPDLCYIINALFLLYRHRNGLCGNEIVQRVCLQQSEHKGHLWLRRIVQHVEYQVRRLMPEATSSTKTAPASQYLNYLSLCREIEKGRK